MSREIKFRVWDVENKEMLNVQELDSVLSNKLLPDVWHKIGKGVNKI
jgi:hypothetical protein